MSHMIRKHPKETARAIELKAKENARSKKTNEKMTRKLELLKLPRDSLHSDLEKLQKSLSGEARLRAQSLRDATDARIEAESQVFPTVLQH